MDAGKPGGPASPPAVLAVDVPKVKALSAADRQETGVEILLAEIEAPTCAPRGLAIVNRNVAGVRVSAGWGPLRRLPLPPKSLGIPRVDNLGRKLWGSTDPRILWIVSDDPEA